jgi:HAD superfamily hydrolase (TIGR01509 family)
VWSRHRDVTVQEHVRALLAAMDPGLPDRIPAPTLEALVVAYARPALMVPPAIDDGARGALEALRSRGLALAVVSNTMRTPGVTLRQLLAHFGLLDSFACTVFSDEVGVRKPDPEIFLCALRALGGEPETSVHVGDDRILDVQGARSAGMRVIQVTSRPLVSGRWGPDAVIPRLAALPDAIGDLAAR